MKRAQRRKYHFIYKTTCKITNRYYYGMHSTDNLDDEYIGSGKRLRYSINKHGIKNHLCEKIEFFETREALRNKEIEIVNENLLKDKLCMNLKVGGTGGFSRKDAIKGNLIRIQVFKHRLKEDKIFYDSYCEKMRKSRIGKKASEKTKKILSIKNTGENNPMYNKKQNITSIIKMKKAKTGCNNPSYGTCWIYNLELKQCKKIFKTEIYLYENWVLGRKMKF